MPTAACKSFEAARGVLKDEPVVYRPVECRRKDSLHHADGVGVEALLDLAGLEGADVGSRELTEPKTSEEGHQVVAVSSLVALEGALADLVAGRVSEPTLEMLTNRQPRRVGE